MDKAVSATPTATLGHGPGGAFSSAGLEDEEKQSGYPFSKLATKPGDKWASLKRPDVYEKLRKQGYSKEDAARISNGMASKGAVAREAAKIKAEALMELLGVSEKHLKEVSHKAMAQTARALLESRIHRAYTVTADELYGRGYLDRDQRLKIGQRLGAFLTKFGEEVDDLGLTGITVDADDVHHIAKIKERAQKHLGGKHDQKLHGTRGGGKIPTAYLPGKSPAGKKRRAAGRAAVQQATEDFMKKPKKHYLPGKSPAGKKRRAAGRAAVRQATEDYMKKSPLEKLGPKQHGKATGIIMNAIGAGKPRRAAIGETVGGRYVSKISSGKASKISSSLAKAGWTKGDRPDTYVNDSWSATFEVWGSGKTRNVAVLTNKFKEVSFNTGADVPADLRNLRRNALKGVSRARLDAYSDLAGDARNLRGEQRQWSEKHLGGKHDQKKHGQRPGGGG